jgi:hypothetical protein
MVGCPPWDAVSATESPSGIGIAEEGAIVPGGTARRRPVVHRRPADATVRELYGTALRCGRPGCMQALYRASDTGCRVLNSQVAHIHARPENGPRWDPAMTEEENRGFRNLCAPPDDAPNVIPFQVAPRQIRRLQLLGGLINEYQPPRNDPAQSLQPNFRGTTGRRSGLPTGVLACAACSCRTSRR